MPYIIMDDIEDNNAMEPITTKPITITITNEEVPIVVLFGPPSSGRSMILVRLCQYLRHNGYFIEPDRMFIPSENQRYQQYCDYFKQSLATNSPLLYGTIEPLLVDIRNSERRPILKLLDAPGEHFFSPERFLIGKQQMPVFSYLHAIMNSRNPKRFVILTDLHVGATENQKIPFSAQPELRSAYESRFLKDFEPFIKYGRDKIILLYNKIDLSNFANISALKVDVKGAKQYAKQNYPNLFNKLTRRSFVFFTKENFQFATFCTGTYSPDYNNGNIIYTHGDDMYPAHLWKLIK